MQFVSTSMQSPRVAADDAEWRRVLREASASEFLPLSQVFATILAYREPSDPLLLWDGHSLFVSDIRLRHRGRPTVLRNEDSALSYVLLEVQESLKLMGNFTLETFQLPTPQDDLHALIVEGEVPKLDTERLRRAVDEAIQKLNAGQRAVFDAVVGCILPGVSSSNLEASFSNHMALQNAESRVFFLDAPGGTGKTFVTRAFERRR